MKYFLHGFVKGFCIMAPVFIALLMLSVVIVSCSMSIENKTLEAGNAVLKNAIDEHRMIEK